MYVHAVVHMLVAVCVNASQLYMGYWTDCNYDAMSDWMSPTNATPQTIGNVETLLYEGIASAITCDVVLVC